MAAMAIFYGLYTMMSGGGSGSGATPVTLAEASDPTNPKVGRRRCRGRA